MKINKINLRKGFTLVELLVVIAIIASLAALSTPAVTKALKKSAVNTSIHNVKQIKTALDLYASDWDGAFIDAASVTALGGTAPTDAASAYTNLILNSSLDASDEELFFTQELNSSGVLSVPHVKGDNDGTIDPDECAYSFVPGLYRTSTSAAPIICTQLAATAGTFYTEIWDHRAVVGRVNGAVKSIRLAGTPTAGTPAQIQESVNGTAGQNIFDWASSAPLK